MQVDYALPSILARDATIVPEASSDEVLVEAIAAGDARAMREFFARHRIDVYRFVLRLTRDASLADDLVSEVFLQVWRKAAGGFEAKSKVSTWLLAIARHKVCSAFRHQPDAQLDEGFAAAIEDSADDPERALHKKDRSALLRECLSKLSPAHREIIDLVYYHEMSIEDVAHIVGIPPATVKTRMHYARNRMAKLLRKTAKDAAWM
jgi:RNA polymerase sigma-70 factor (ECF subfamily)